MDVAIGVRNMTRRCAHDRAPAIRDDREDFVYPRAIRVASIRIGPASGRTHAKGTQWTSLIDWLTCARITG